MENISLFKQNLRRAKWLFSNSGVLALGIEHFLAMVPATILVPIMVNNAIGETVIDMSLVLFTSGIGTILFTVFSKGRIPAYLGSSFAYIGLTIYLIESHVSPDVTPQMAYSYVGWSYIFSGALLSILSFLYKKTNIDRILSFILPASVIGPAISLIGLELSDTAIADSGFDLVNGVVDKNAVLVSLVTLIAIILFSLMKKKRLKNVSIIAGMVVGFAVYSITNGLPDFDFSGKIFTAPDFSLPILSVPPNLVSLFVAVIPATFIIFTENIGRVTVINQMVSEDKNNSGIFNKESIKQLHTGLLSHGLSTVIVTLMGSVPNTVYAENIAVMGIHNTEAKDDPDKFIRDLTKPFSLYPYFVAAIIAISFSFIDALQTILLGIPKAVIGGMELFLFGIISAPGIQMLVDQRVNYKKASNQIITAAVLITGVSGLTVDLGFVELKGMSLGFVVGILLNLLVQLLKWIGNTSDVISFDELLEESLGAIINTDKEKSDENDHTVCFELSGRQFSMDAYDLLLALQGSATQVQVNGISESADWAIDTIKHSSCADLKKDNKKLFSVEKTANSLIIDIVKENLNKDIISIYLNDYPEAIDADEGEIHINISENIPMRRIRELIGASVKGSEDEVAEVM